MSSHHPYARDPLRTPGTLVRLMYDHSSRPSVFVRGDFPNPPKAAPHLCFAPFAHYCQDVLLQTNDAKMNRPTPQLSPAIPLTQNHANTFYPLLVNLGEKCHHSDVRVKLYLLSHPYG
jgi:hypothetical protein